MAQQRLKRGTLGAVQKLASGGQGVVYPAPGVQMAHAKTLVFKEYKSPVLPNIRVDVLENMPSYLESLPFAEGMELLKRAAWPCRLVEEDHSTTVLGFVMPAIPDEFFIDMVTVAGTRRVTAEFQHLLNDDVYLAKRGIPLTDRARYELLGDAAEALALLHRHHIAVGDLSPKNLLFSLRPDRRVYFIDCDAMRMRSQSVSDQFETPDWDVRTVSAGEELATPQSDAYKFALLVLRLLAGHQSTRDPDRLPAGVPAAVRQLVRTGLSAPVGQRPRPADWRQALDAAAAGAGTRTPVRPRVVPPGTTPPLPRARGRTPWWQRVPLRAWVIGAIAAVVVVAGLLTSTTSSEDDPPVAGGSLPVAAAPATVTTTIPVGAQPWGVAADTETATVFATNSVSNTVSAYDTETGATASITSPDFAKPTAIAVDSAAGLAYVTNAGNGSVSVIRTRDRTVVGQIAVGAGPYGIAVNPAGRTAYVTNFEAGTMSVIDLRSRAVVATIPVGSRPYGVAFDPATRSVFVAIAGAPESVDRRVAVVDAAARSVVTSIRVGNQPWGVAVDTGTDTAYVTNHADGTVSVIDTRTRAVTATVPVGSGPVGVAVDRASRTVFVTNHGLDNVRSGNSVSLIDTRNNVTTQTIRVGARPHGIAVDPAAGQVYVSNFNDGSMSVLGNRGK
ncbi:hypothetical protein [Nocardia bhagyanarayanae]|uniref:YVTN family beta-propeller protein n=1 Tax=Nocardia bhagyanarayanae TaxID=1215925 RepID=A0A543FIF2_9NOCA|nr:hypothetical protein [Nocardia bhagyanarayanae]TQM33647.1 YVTN family beta-propeller protein [Nocardia bhagyanarayanae]